MKTFIKYLLILGIVILSVPLAAISQISSWNQLHPKNSPSPRIAHSMASLGNGKVLLFGGNGFIDGKCCSFLNDTWIFDNRTKEWVELKPSISLERRSNHRICQLSEDKVLLFGGSNGETEYYDDTWLFDLKDTSWQKLDVSNHPNARSHFGLSQISENKALLFGGRDYHYDSQRDTWIFDLDKMDWTNVIFNKYSDNLPYYLIDPMMSQIEQGKVILNGGKTESTQFYLTETWKFELDSMKWKKLYTNGITDSLWCSGICGIIENKLLIFGGSNLNNFLDDTWLFDYTNLTWRKINVNEKPVARSYTSMVKLEEGNAVLFGGLTHEDRNGETWLFSLGADGVESNNESNELFLYSSNNENIRLSVILNKPSLLGIYLIDFVGNIAYVINNQIYENGISEFNIPTVKLTSGVYIIRIVVDSQVYFRKLMIIK
jgi:N-acetylneuraminic acid mutarotase